MTPTPTHTVVTPYKTYNYSLLHMKGLSHLLDLMRYERAFLCREADLNLLLATMGNEESFILKLFTFLLCKYDWKGVTKPSWTPGRLLSSMEMEEIRDPIKLYELNLGRDPIFSIKTPLKFRADVIVKAPLRMILKIMFLNNAFPSEEGHAHEMERAFYDPDKEIEVSLTNFMSAKEGWRFPKEFIL